MLLTAEDAISGSVRVNDEKILAEAQGLSRAVGARGQMFMQKLLVNRGGELPEPELRTRMITLAGTEPSTLFGMSEVLGVNSPDAKTLQQQMVGRMAIISDPASVLVGNPDLLQSLQTTENIAKKVIAGTTSSLTSAVDKEATSARNAAIRDAAIVLGGILAALVLVLLVARALVRPLRRLREGALRVAHEDLPAEIERINAGEQPMPIEPIAVQSTEEIGQVAHAVDDLHEQALLMAAEQTRLQVHVSDMFETMSRRSRSLVDQQLSLIDDLERNEQDPQRLAALFKLDHLAARMRRNGTNLLVLSGAKIRREQTESMPVAAIIGAAASQVEDYQRVVTATVPDSAVVGFGGGRHRASARRIDRQCTALLATGLGGAGLGGAHRQSRARHRGERCRPRHDRGRPPDRQYATGVGRRGHAVHHPAHGPVRGRTSCSTARAGGEAAQLGGRRAPLGHDRGVFIPAELIERPQVPGRTGPEHRAVTPMSGARPGGDHRDHGVDHHVDRQVGPTGGGPGRIGRPAGGRQACRSALPQRQRIAAR